MKDWQDNKQQRDNELFKKRVEDQKKINDYDDDMEKCECGCYLNSHGHCPRCDY